MSWFVGLSQSVSSRGFSLFFCFFFGGGGEGVLKQVVVRASEAEAMLC